MEGGGLGGSGPEVLEGLFSVPVFCGRDGFGEGWSCSLYGCLTWGGKTVGKLKLSMVSLQVRFPPPPPVEIDGMRAERHSAKKREDRIKQEQPDHSLLFPHFGAR